MSKALSRYIKLYNAFLMQHWKTRMAYRGDFILDVFCDFAIQLIGFVFIFIFFNNIHAIQGWRFEQVLFIYGFAQIPLVLTNVFCSSLYGFGAKYINQGALDWILLHPINSLFHVLVAERGGDLGNIVTGVIALVYSIDKLKIHLPLNSLIILFLAVIIGIIIYTSLFVIIASLSFWIRGKGGTTWGWFVIMHLSRFGQFPLTIYDRFVRFLISWVIPISFTSFIPAAYILEGSKWLNYMLCAPFVAAAFFSIACILWKSGLARYESTGS